MSKNNYRSYQKTQLVTRFIFMNFRFFLAQHFHPLHTTPQGRKKLTNNLVKWVTKEKKICKEEKKFCSRMKN